MIDYLFIFSFILSCVVLFGFFLNAKKKMISWIIWIITDTISLITMLIFFPEWCLIYIGGIGLDIYGLYKWVKNKKC